VILIDSNVPTYLIGAPHVHKTDAQRLLEKAVAAREKLLTDAEVLQEILHRYIAVNRREAIQPAFDALFAFADEVLPIKQSTVEDAKQTVLGYRQLSARDAIHLAIRRQHGIDQILSFDTGFDSFPGIKRIS